MKDYEVTPPPDRPADRVQLRTAFSTERGVVTEFVVQLEYWLRATSAPPTAGSSTVPTAPQTGRGAIQMKIA
jgi:hypothetical protein